MHGEYAPTDRRGFLAGGGDTRARTRAHGWSATPLGSPDGWPQPLKTLVGAMLGLPRLTKPFRSVELAASLAALAP